MREYETLFIVRPDCAEGPFAQLTDKVGAIIGKHKGSILKYADMGMRTLAYRVKKQTKGRYICFDYAANASAVVEVERFLRFDENVLRFLTIVLNDEVDIEARKKEIEIDKTRLAEGMEDSESESDTSDLDFDHSAPPRRAKEPQEASHD